MSVCLSVSPPLASPPALGPCQFKRGDALRVLGTFATDEVGDGHVYVRAVRDGQETGDARQLKMSEVEFFDGTLRREQGASSSSSGGSEGGGGGGSGGSDGGNSLELLLRLLAGLASDDEGEEGGSKQAAIGPPEHEFVTDMLAGKPVPRAFKDGYRPVTDSEPVKVDLKIGDWVRVRRNVVKVIQGWGSTCCGEIGQIVRTDKDGDPVVAFPSSTSFVSEWCELQRTVYLEPGDHVKVRSDVSRPVYGWGKVSKGDIGVVRAVDCLKNVAIVHFKTTHRFHCKITELEWATERCDRTNKGSFSIGDHLRIREHVISTRYGDGDVKRGEVGVVHAIDRDGDPILRFPSQDRWQGSVTDLEDGSAWAVGDLAQLKDDFPTASGSMYRKGTVGMVLDIDSSGKFRMEFERAFASVSPSCLTDATHRPDSVELYHARPKLAGTFVRVRSGSKAAKEGLNQDQVGIVMSAKYDKNTHSWMTIVNFPKKDKWVCNAKDLVHHPANLMRGDWVSLSPTLRKPLLGWGAAEGKLRHGDVGVVVSAEKKQISLSGRKAMVYHVRWAKGFAINFLHSELVPARRAP